jgi:hypothetical protein
MGRNKLVALETEDVSIATATVSIKVLQVNNRQMTQSVFRQLPERGLIDDETIELLGVPWGWVNYTASGMGDGRQFVVQFGTTLCRSSVPLSSSLDWRSRVDNAPYPYQEMHQRYIEMSTALVFLRALRGIRPVEEPSKQYGGLWSVALPKLGPFFPKYLDIHVREHNAIAFACEDIKEPVRGEQEKRFSGYTDDEWPQYLARCRADQEKRRSDAVATLRNLVEDHGVDPDGTPERHEVVMRAFADKASDYCRRWDLLIERLKTVEQLYIAV